MTTLDSLNIKLFADGAQLSIIEKMSHNPVIKGFTTNPTLMKKANIFDYEGFAKDVLAIVSDRPVCFEVFSDDFPEMEAQAKSIASWGDNVYVKIPISNTKGEPSNTLIQRLSQQGVKLNITALMTVAQVKSVLDWLTPNSSGFISVFAGRIADTGRDPLPIIAESVQIMKSHPNMELIWASPRELLNIFQADSVGCQVLTATNDILNKLDLIGKDLEEFSLETVQMFRRDAVNAGFSITTEKIAVAV